VDDSKKLDAETREGLAQEIRGVAVAVGVGVAEVDEIDKLNIYQAALLAMQRALKRLAVAPDRVLTDARRVPGVSVPQHNIIKGDARCLCIAAASIIAKTHRDGLMDGLDRAHPGYGFAQHKGYATPEHMEALLALGPSPVHRRSFAPVKDLLAGAETSAQRDLFKR
jgi:ribonuclease HII